MIVAFTGPHKPKVSNRVIQGCIDDALDRLNIAKVNSFISGAAHGVDTLAYYSGVRLRPDADHWVFIPTNDDKVLWHNEQVVSDAREAGHFTLHVPGGYIKRDEAMVQNATVLLAFPNSMCEERRSGTWTTIRRAWKYGTSVMFLPLDGKPGPVVRCT
jgi:hypothetical protein